MEICTHLQSFRQIDEHHTKNTNPGDTTAQPPTVTRPLLMAS
jgi:hypothetical protein